LFQSNYTHMQNRLTKLFAAVLIAALPTLVHAQLDCVVKTREEGFDPKQPGAAELQRAARAAAAIVQKNAVFMAGNKPVRVRTSISYGGWDRQSASVITGAYNQKAWLAGGCEINKFADRGGGLRDGVIAVYINEPSSLLGGQLGDAQLKVSRLPTLLGNVAGFPTYAAGGDAQNPRMLLSRAGYQPWVSVTVAEVLDWRERELNKREQEYQAATQPNDSQFDETKIEQIYRDMKQVNAAEAEKTRTQLLAALQQSRARNAKSGAADLLAKQRSSFDAYRASFTPAQLAAQGSISHAMTRDGVVRVDDPAGTLLAKIDPRYALKNPAGIHIVVVSLAQLPKTDPNYAWFQTSLEALDYTALSKLLSD
jgi:hypothetical protein